MVSSLFRTKCSLVTYGKSAQDKSYRSQHDQTRGATASRNTTAFVETGKANENICEQGRHTHSVKRYVEQYARKARSIVTLLSERKKIQRCVLLQGYPVTNSIYPTPP